MVVALFDSLRDGTDVGHRAGGRNSTDQSTDKKDHKVAQDGIEVHKSSLRDGCTECFAGASD